MKLFLKNLHLDTAFNSNSSRILRVNQTGGITNNKKINKKNFYFYNNFLHFKAVEFTETSRKSQQILRLFKGEKLQQSMQLNLHFNRKTSPKFA